MIRLARIAVLAAVAAVASVATVHAADPAAVLALKQALQSGMDHGDVAAMQKARAGFAALSAAEPKDARLHYWVAFADWRITPMAMRTDKAVAARHAKQGLEHLEQALAVAPKDAECLALKGGLQGMSISFKPSSAMSLGPQSQGNIERARKLAADNPRVWLIDAIGELNKPALFGGGADPALETLEKAQALFAAETVTDPAAPDWGRDDVWTWTGRAHAKKKQWKDAVAAYEKALAANPANGWVRTQLLPEAQGALAKSND